MAKNRRPAGVAGSGTAGALNGVGKAEETNIGFKPVPRFPLGRVGVAGAGGLGVRLTGPSRTFFPFWSNLVGVEVAKGMKIG